MPACRRNGRHAQSQYVRIGNLVGMKVKVEGDIIRERPAMPKRSNAKTQLLALLDVSCYLGFSRPILWRGSRLLSLVPETILSSLLSK